MMVEGPGWRQAQQPGSGGGTQDPRGGEEVRKAGEDSAKREHDRNTSIGFDSQECVAWEQQLLRMLGVGQAAEGRMEG